MSPSNAIDPAPEHSLAAADRPATSGAELHLEAVPAKRSIPLVFKLTLLVGITLTLLVGVLVVANGLFWQGILRKTVDSHLSSVAATRADMVRAQMTQLLQRVEINSDRGEFRGILSDLATGADDSENRRHAQATLDRTANGKPVVGAMIVDLGGRVVVSSDPRMLGRDVHTYASFQAGLLHSYFGVPLKGKTRYVATLAAPIRGRDDPQRVYGVLLFTTDISEMASALSDTTGLGETGDTLLGMRDGKQIRLLLPPRNSPDVTTLPGTASPTLMAAVEGRELLMKHADYRGIPVVAAGHPIGYGAWGLVVKMDAKEAYLPILRVVQLEVLAGVAVIGLGLLAAYIVARRFTRPVRQLAEATFRVKQGDYETVVPVNSSDEFGFLSAHFNEMTAAIRIRRREREEAGDALRIADRRKDEFLAMLGHELRNPLSAIANAVRLWSVAGDDRDATELARSVIERQTGNLSRLVDDLLDVSRITEGKIDLRRRPVDVAEAIRRSAESARSFVEDRRHELELALEADAALWVDADPTRLEQIIANLLTNAIKYTPKGGRLRIEARIEGTDVLIRVIDNGVGIAPRMLPQIFELFTQGDRSLDRTTGGLGIGLNLCRKLVELHGGTIMAASEGVGRGSTFTVRLPRITVPDPVMLPEPSAHREPGQRQRRILLVDDNQDTVHSLARLLTLRGHEVATAFDGVAALNLAQQFKPDFLLLDIGLPGIDGYELARRLRSLGFARTPIVAISGYAQEGDRARSREAGFNYHFAKPVDFEALAELILEDPISEE